MGDTVRGFSWHGTPLGSPERWPAELQAAVAWVLESQFPMARLWGPGQVTIYNDAFRPILGNKPEALGRSFAETWTEVWHAVGPLVEQAYAGKPSFFDPPGAVEVDMRVPVAELQER